MRELEVRFLEALRASLKNDSVDWAELPQEDWHTLFRWAEQHHVLPMIYQAVYGCPAARALDPQLLQPVRRSMLRSVMMQTVKTDAFLRLYKGLTERGLRVLVVKGAVCRSLYPHPDDRMSGDEDLLAPPELFAACNAALVELGMRPTNPDADVQTACELSYDKPGSPLYIELHKTLFPARSEAYGEFNRFFEDAFQRAIPQRVQGGTLWTLEHTEHLLYLILHAFKHFLHSGVGIRQVCDITLYANAYGGVVDWQRILECCRAIRAERFAAVLFRIGEKYLTFDPVRACYPEYWREYETDETALLADLLQAGVYGDAQMSRKHSSNITLNAVASQKRGKRAGSGLRKSLFPSAESLSGRYPYLRRSPWLLPVAWSDRFLQYCRETRSRQDSTASDALKIGGRRVELLRQYGVLEQDSRTSHH